MKNTLLSLTTLLVVTSSASAALSIVANNTTNFRIQSGGSTWDTTTFPPANNANVYWDANSDGIFGNSAGENTGNTQPTLNFTINPITSGTPYFFAVEGFGGTAATGTTSFTLTNTDNTTQALTVTEGTITSFSDSNGDTWQADFVFNQNGYGDVVSNGGSGAGNVAGRPNDHQGILTFSQIPEPSSTALLGLAGLSFILRRRR